MNPNAPTLADLRQSLEQIETLQREGLTAFVSLKLSQLATEANNLASLLAAKALNQLGGVIADLGTVRVHVPQFDTDARAPHAPALGHVVALHTEPCGSEVIHPETAAS